MEEPAPDHYGFVRLSDTCKRTVNCMGYAYFCTCKKCGSDWILYEELVTDCPSCAPELFEYFRYKQEKPVVPPVWKPPVDEIKPIVPTPPKKPFVLVESKVRDDQIRALISEEKAFADYKGGKTAALGFLIGMVRKKYRCDPDEAKARIEKIAKESEVAKLDTEVKP
jgi:predicted  nucleic acid-binding Zn-ribbon protein